MAFTAGQRVTAAMLSWDTSAVALTDMDTTPTGSFGQWGTETVVFANPGIPVKVRGWLTGRIVSTTQSDTNTAARVAISIDGGTTFTPGTDPAVNVGTSVGTRAAIAAGALVEGTPTGDIIIKAEVLSVDSGTDAQDGYLMADVFPQ